LVNDQIKWEGSLEPGKGYKNKDYAQAIVLSDKPGFSLPLEKVEPAENEIQAANNETTKIEVTK
jgi:hypothetical protein